MIPNSQVISTYEAILEVTGQMLHAAQSHDWERLIDFEAECRSLIEVLQLTDKQPLADGYQVRKADIIRKVLADDAEIRNLTQPWLAQLGQLLGSIDNTKKLKQSYGTDHGQF
jgi:flagellar protein FliT